MQDIISWKSKTQKRHLQCLNWQSDGVIALGIHVPTKKKKRWDLWMESSEAYLEFAMEQFERDQEVQSDLVPRLHANFAAILVPSLFGAKIDVEPNGPVYHPLVNSWDELESLKNWSKSSPMLDQAKKTFDHFLKHAPEGVDVLEPWWHSPLDTAALLREPLHFYTDVYTNPDEVRKFLDIITEATLHVMSEVYGHIGRPMTPFTSPVGIHLGDRVHISDDCCVNLSPDTLEPFSTRYLRRMAQELGIKWCTHYCIMPPHSLSEQCLPPIQEEPAIEAIYNQYPPDYFLDHYEDFENRLALICAWDPFKGITDSRERVKQFRVWADDFLKQFAGKSGLVLQVWAQSIEEAQEIYGYWSERVKWPEEV